MTMTNTSKVVPFLFRGPEIDVEALYRRYGPMVLRRCRAILGDEESAQDAMQDVFVLLLRKKDRLVGEYPSSLLYRMATNRCLNVIRSEKRRRDAPDEETLARLAAPGSLEEQAEGRDLVDRLFDGERESTIRMVTLHHRDGMTLRETAAVVGMSESGVRKRMRSLRTKGAALLSA
jgi:RNA polymerase sigma-70 factor (ECF subfamily)